MQGAKKRKPANGPRPRSAAVSRLLRHRLLPSPYCLKVASSAWPYPSDVPGDSAVGILPTVPFQVQFPVR